MLALNYVTDRVAGVFSKLYLPPFLVFLAFAGTKNKIQPVNADWLQEGNKTGLIIRKILISSEIIHTLQASNILGMI